MAAQGDVLPVGSIFHDHYEVVRCMGVGGMGAVYEVLDARTRRRRALKVMLPALVSDPNLRARFRFEATVTADIESEHIVEVLDAGVDAATGAPFLVMELLRGEDLDKVLTRRGRLPADEVVQLLSQVAHALDRTHALGIVHRDLKPENLFLAKRDDGSPRLKVLDFGIAKLVAQSAQRAKTTGSVGTPLYMPPEQIQGHGTIDARADLYALGHIAFALLVGRPYWEPEARSAGAVYSLLVKVMTGAQEPASARAAALGVPLPPAFDAWFARATALAPQDRFDRASESIVALVEALGLSAPHTAPFGSPIAPLDAARTSAAHAATLASGVERTIDGSSTAAAVSTDPRPAAKRSTAPALIAAAVAVTAAGIGWAALRIDGTPPVEQAAASESATAEAALPPPPVAPPAVNSADVASAIPSATPPAAASGRALAPATKPRDPAPKAQPTPRTPDVAPARPANVEPDDPTERRKDPRAGGKSP